MLYIVLALVVAAFGLLIAALATANTLWAWISVGLSVVAAVLLVVDWLAGRRKVAATVAPSAERADTAPTGELDAVPAEDIEGAEDIEPDEDEELDSEPVAVPADAEPAEEATDATDLLLISELDAEVRVVDEHPRYHLARCTWLSGKATIPLPVSEARQLGFTPCARCGPDAALAAEHRAGRGAAQ